MQKQTFAILLAFALSGCATSAAGLYETSVKKTVLSSRTSQAFATCVAESLVGAAQLRSDGDHYWVLRMVLDIPRHRWDFTPTPAGSKAELRSTGFAGDGEDKVRACA